MAVVFPGWQPVEAKMVHMMELPKPFAEKAAQVERIEARVEPIYVVRLDEQHAVMLTQTQPVDDEGVPMACHPCSGHLGAYFFTLDDRGWRLSGSQHSAVETGLHGHLGETQIIQFAPQRYAFAAKWGSCWQGYCGDWLTLVDLQPGLTKVLAASIPIASSSTGAHYECMEPQTRADDSSPEEQAPIPDCFEVNSTWELAGERLTMRFKEAYWRGDQHQPPPVLNNTAVYRIRNGELVLESGKNPVPPL